MANNSIVCHSWAHGFDTYHWGSSLMHQNGILTSYNTAIGQRIEHNDKIIFVTDNGSYSNSTNKHQNYMMRAIPNKESNVYVFSAPYTSWNRSRFININALENDSIVFGLMLLLAEFQNCLGIKTCKSLNHGFSYYGYDEMVRWFDVTGVASINKLLKFKVADFNKAMESAFDMANISYNIARVARKYFKAFLKMMYKRVSIPEIIDEINGFGTWELYQNRTKGVRTAAKCRRLSEFLGETINQKVIKEHSSDGHIGLIRLMLELRKNKIRDEQETNKKIVESNNKNRACRNLEKHLGMSGFIKYIWSSKRAFDTFDYNGTIIDLTEAVGYKERHLTAEEYEEFVDCDDKTAWMRSKRQWMLEQLFQDKAKHEEAVKRMAEEERIRQAEHERLEKLLAEKQAHIQELKQLGDEGIRQLYHEGFNITLPYNNATIYNGGNVLMRVNPIRKVVETSKAIAIKFEDCKRLWTAFKYWHEHPDKCEKGFIIPTTTHEYTVHSFENGILTAGCHQIAFSEMQYIAQQLNL